MSTPTKEQRQIARLELCLDEAAKQSVRLERELERVKARLLAWVAIARGVPPERGIYDPATGETVCGAQHSDGGGFRQGCPGYYCSLAPGHAGDWHEAQREGACVRRWQGA